MKRVFFFLVLLPFILREESSYAKTLELTDRSVYAIEPGRDIALTSLALGVGGGIYLFGKNWIKPSCPCEKASINALDQVAVGNNSETARLLSDLGAVAAVGIFPVFDFFDLGFSQTLFEDAVVFTKTMATSFALVSLAKHLMTRPIPRVVAGQAPELVHSPEGYRSFYSAHTTLAFTALSAAAMTLTARYDLGIWPWVFTGALGTTVAVSRVLGGAHYPTDVLVGAGMGILTGVAIPSWHRNNKKSESAVYFLPSSSGGAQFVVVKTW